ncbi:MarR family transcriptional regulator [Kitasatospora sp. NPDC101157]|uniref:MarR family transcriptional regulator n=1 Tax=Kitasatospora sp. NPDC101157 TaxID=3364098 RepID=UPI00381F1734
MNTTVAGSGVPTGPEFSGSLIQRAWEAPEEVVFPRYLIDGPGLQPEDIGVLAHLLLRNPGAPSSVAALAAECRQRGWKISEYAMRGIVKRLKTAGHIQQDRVHNPVSGQLDWVFSVYRNPANNQKYVGSVDGQLPSSRPFVGSQQMETDHSLRANESAGQSHSLGVNEWGTSRWEPTNGEGRVSARRGRFVGSQRMEALPPHPPEEVDTSSPNPLTQPVAPAGEEEAGFTAEETAAAELFLQQLPAPWAAGRRTAARLAPKLLEAAAEQGWDLGQVLVAELTKNPDGIKSFSRVLALRIDDLPLRSAVTAPASGRRPAVPAPLTDLPAWCEDLDCDRETRRRAVTDDRGFTYTGPCPDCHPDSATRKDAA